MAVGHLTMGLGEYGYKKRAVVKIMFFLEMVRTWCWHYLTVIDMDGN